MTFFEGENALQQCEEWLKRETVWTFWKRWDNYGAVFLENRSRYNLELVTSNCYSGYPQYDVQVF